MEEVEIMAVVDIMDEVEIMAVVDIMGEVEIMVEEEDIMVEGMGGANRDVPFATFSEGRFHSARCDKNLRLCCL